MSAFKLKQENSDLPSVWTQAEHCSPFSHMRWWSDHPAPGSSCRTGCLEHVKFRTDDWLRKWTQLLGLLDILLTDCKSTFLLYVLYAAYVWPLQQSTLCSTSSKTDMLKMPKVDRTVKGLNCWSKYSSIQALQWWDHGMRMTRLTFTVSVGHVHHVVLASVEESEPRLAVQYGWQGVS